MAEESNVVPIGAPHPEKMQRVEELVELYRSGKATAIAVIVGTEDGSADWAFVDAQPRTHSARTVYCQFGIAADFMLRNDLL